MLDILFAFSAFQCGANAPQAEFRFEVTVENVQYDILPGETVRIEGINALHEADSLNISVLDNGSCVHPTPTYETLVQGQEIPEIYNAPGAYNQESLQEVVDTYLPHEWMVLHLFELGTTNVDSPIFDLQDIVIVTNSNPDTECLVDCDITSTPTPEVYPAD